jgi:HD-like signal output (HDOD) protein
MEIVDKLLKGVDDFPTLPTIYTTLSDVMANPLSTANHAADVILRDQASAAKVLKTANSSIYGFRGRIDTISQAIFYIGFDEVKNLVLALSIIDLFSESSLIENLNPVELWKHSIAVGVATRIIGVATKADKIENYFLAGILHDIGKLLFIKNMEEEYNNTINYALEKKITIREAEAELLGMTHTVAGELIAEKWKLPISIRNAIRHHYIGIVNGVPDKLAASVHISNILCQMLRLGESGHEIIKEANIDVWKELDLPNNFFSTMIPKLLADYEESLTLFQLK